MNLITVFQRFPDQEACIEHLEAIRFGDEPFCPLCGSLHVARKADGDRIGRWNCHVCKGSLNVLSGTIFQKTRIPLQKWFLGIGLMANAKKSISSHQLARDLDVAQSTALYMQARIRASMAAEDRGLLQGIIEADETYIGGKPRKGNKHDDDDTPNPRGRGTKKTPVIGAVERGGRVVAQAADGKGDLTGPGILQFIKENVDTDGSLLITDEYKAYNAVNPIMRRAVIKHAEQYADGATHTNTIEGFWSLVKRAWFGSHHHYSRKYLPLFMAESCWKYNHWDNDDAFGTFLQGAMA